MNKIDKKEISYNFLDKPTVHNIKEEEYYLNKYKPILYLHPNEKVSPISWESYINNSIYLEKDRINYNGSIKKPDQNKINNIPFYGFVYENTNNTFFLDICYIFLYPLNPGYKIIFLKDIGYHTGDIEYIIIRINIYTEKIIKVFFSSHSIEHQIKYYDKLKICKYCKKLKVFVSLGSHANYNKPKTYFRFIGFANDKTSMKGIYWHPNNVINLKTMKKQNFKSIGLTKKKKYSVNGLFNKKYIFKDYFITNWKRFFLCCFIKK